MRRPGGKANGKSGFTLLELAIVLTIGGIIIAAIWLLLSDVNRNRQQGQMSRDVLQIIHDTKAVFSQQGTQIGDFTSNDAAAAGIFPANWVIRDGNDYIIRHPFSSNVEGSSVTMTDSDAGTGLNNFIALTVGIENSPDRGLPADACVRLVGQLATRGNYQNLGIRSINVSNGRARTSFPLTSLPLAVSRIAGSCATATSSAVEIIFDPA